MLTARVHPGETPSSWIMRGVINFLTGDTDVAEELRDKFIFKVRDAAYKKGQFCISILEQRTDSYFVQ